MTLTIPMPAAHARQAVFTALAAVPGIQHAEVEAGRAVIDHDGTVTVEAIAAAIAVVGCVVTSAEVSRRTLPTVADERPDEAAE